MRFLLVCCLLAFFGSDLYAQDDYMTEIADKTCDCLNEMPDGIDESKLTMELGLCMIKLASPYRKEILADYGIDMENLGEQGEKLGELVGLRMSTICPDALMALAGMSEEEEEEVEELLVVTGKITKVDDKNFVVFTLKDEQGKSAKYTWLTFVESSFELADDYASLSGKNVSISYDSLEFFDPKIKEYRLFNIIREIALVE